ncbi:MAG: hypothetical protein OEV64_00700 [Desulfobulbaceae bacterium]|nr:hypothetical protein [Desulfobulbaceae bacterium]
MNSIKIAVPTLDNSGLSAKISDHFGHCRLFTIVDLTGKDITNVETFTNPEEQEGSCSNLIAHLAERGVGTVVAYGMGGGMFEKCSALGVRVLLADRELHGDVGTVINDLISGNLTAMQHLNLCKGNSGPCRGH